MEQGWDPDVKNYFLVILRAISWGLMWMMMGVTAGLYFGLAWPPPVLPCVVFYIVQLSTLVLLIRYYIRLFRHINT